MQIDSKILDDIVKMATSAFGNANQIRKDMEDNFKARLEGMFAGLGISVTREEFEALRQQVAKLGSDIEEMKLENSELRRRVYPDSKVGY